MPTLKFNIPPKSISEKSFAGADIHCNFHIYEVEHIQTHVQRYLYHVHTSLYGKKQYHFEVMCGCLSSPWALNRGRTGKMKLL